MHQVSASMRPTDSPPATRGSKKDCWRVPTGPRVLITILLVTMFALTPARASEPARIEVSLDWSRVSDAVIKRCKLSGLESLLFQGLVDANYALVRDVGPSGIRLSIAE